jgi:hypothetical protein
MCEAALMRCSKSPTFRATKRRRPEGAFGWLFQTGDHPMVLVSSYLALTARRPAVRATLSAARVALRRTVAVIAASGQALSEAQEMRRAMTQKHPFIDI